MEAARKPPLNRAAQVAPNGRVRRVAIIDDDYWTLQGQRARLTDHRAIEVVATVGHAEAIAWTTRWNDIDVAVIDAYDPEETFDRFPGVGVVESLRRHRTVRQTTAVVISGHMHNQLLKQRMFEAGADFYYHRSDVQTVDALIAAIQSTPTDNRATEADPTRLRQLGLRPGSRPNAAIVEVINADMQDALNPIESQKSSDASRRAFINLRERVERHSKLSDDITSAASSDAHTAPTWRTTRRFLNRALGRDLVEPDN
jgi:DNA-binding NarL/FixJ family response regulator